MHFDLLIRNAKIVDGAGVPWYKSDIGISGDKIVRIGNLVNATATIEIDASNKILSPGFIDTHTHFDLVPFAFAEAEDQTNKRRLYQGITTQIVGCCGISPAPISENKKSEWFDRTFALNNYKDAHWNSFSEYLEQLDHCCLGTNYACYVGHGTIRYNVMGYDDRSPNKEEMEKMKKLLAQSIEGGAIGMSTGLIYPPGVFASTEELVNLSSVLKKYNAIYASHIRNENTRWMESINEVIEIAMKNNIPAIIHHVKTKAKDSEQLVKNILQAIHDARNSNVDITFEQYPYEASSTGLTVILSSWIVEGGKDKILARLKDHALFKKMHADICKDYKWQNEEEEWAGSKNILILSAKNHEHFIGKTIYEIAKALGKKPIEAAFKILIGSDLQSYAAYFGIKQSDIKEIMNSPYGMFGSDSDPTKIGEHVHPRANGTFPRILGKYVREEKTISLENAIYKMTGFPATKFNLHQRGLIKENFYADIVLFDDKKIADTTTYVKPFEKPEGIDYVIVNGSIAIKNGEFTNKFAGKVLRKKY
ncbi:N-acyl-D-amino-acid deacylase family protein [Marinisporobacter balticus]|uniref:N-acyl-D-amino-acid deacylase n=1 Tax=Marinisporobacter balticus TaxID=2018667 RepID=A0A4R2KDN1_9FIRM|nr:D-aminoacylase [Marinisporobacter balticus]TCO71054.1 N-acyl-D-amino-acid deacylase [Marinisporobacter balticus]